MAPAPKPIDESEYSGRLAVRLRKLREKAGLSVEQACKRIEEAGYPISPQTYYGWENGRRQPNWDALPALAKALRTSIRAVVPIK